MSRMAEASTTISAPPQRILDQLRQEGFGEGPDWDWYHDAAVKGWPDALAAVKRSLEARGA